jgi:hypothetical protein
LLHQYDAQIDMRRDGTWLLCYYAAPCFGGPGIIARTLQLSGALRECSWVFGMRRM